ncbi:MAG: methyltransferase [Candidatus Brocadia sinica]|nr:MULTISPECIES: class I SAM-dependent rRNA methyltransferase [Brocadia]KXK28353.1 MAG: methyltransferase [Candidatus Brocadia sinica]MCK6468008.1 class I SAM-dependent rRNA methyltransferase [Candidatus Brocadia sinica]NOG43306.1 class I SAM-dependent rRNA methyltransferase [Planctomycetota bacterium]NUO05327.1 class I SAM-dependent rRNA methyltransferase [Candidatus Brocadia sinica]
MFQIKMLPYNSIIHKAWSLRRKYINHTTTNAYRLVNSYGDTLPEVTIDIYGKNILVQYFQPYEERAKNGIYHALKETTTPENITAKIRLKGEDIKTYSVYGTEIPKDFLALENGIKFDISFHEGGGTGLFLDQRDNRRKVQSLAKGKEVLNCFCYTSSFSVYASLGGAARTVNVDLSRKAIEWSKKNFILNQIDVNNHEFIMGDVWDWIRRFQKKGRTFDMIIIDPPSFSTGKTTIFAVEKDFPKLIGQGLGLLREDGILVFSTNIAKMNFSKFFQLFQKVKNFTSKSYKLVGVSSQGLDFPIDGIHLPEPYLKFVMLTC